MLTKIMIQDYIAGKTDCKAGYYDKWYSLNRPDKGHAYDAGWCKCNKIVQNKKVEYLEPLR